MVRNYGLGDGMDEQTSAAMTDVSKVWKDKLVASNVVDKDDPVWFVPVPGSPNTWRLKYFAAGGVPLDVTHEVTRTGADGKEHTEEAFIDIIPAAVRVNHGAWKRQEDDKKARNAQTFEHFGLSSDATADDLQHTLKLIPKNASYKGNEGQYQDGVAFRELPVGLNTPEKRAKAQEFGSDPANRLQTFADFITANH
jgi:hypothetical protein